MKTKIILKTCLTVSVFLLITAVAFGDMSSWLDNTDTEIVPSNPTSHDIVCITLSGWWPDSCIPIGSAISVEGDHIYFDVIDDPNLSCWTVPTEWAQTQYIGPLPAGMYTVYACLVDWLNWPLHDPVPVAEFTVTATIYYVNAADGNDNNDGLSPETAFATIQKGIDTAQNGDTVMVYPGLYVGLWSDLWYTGVIYFNGKNITVTSIDPTNPDIVKNTIVRAIVLFSGTEGPNCTFTGFSIDYSDGAIYGNHTHATISYCVLSNNVTCGVTVVKDCDGTISNCVITNNDTIYDCGIYPVVFGCHGLIRNCTIANNISSGICTVAGGITTIENCIIYNNDGPYQIVVASGATLNISYSDVQGGLGGISSDGTVNWGPGNIDADPCFVELGCWPSDIGDYHLRSERGRYWPEHNVWVLDDVTSPCIDGGDPNVSPSNELVPNGGCINMGAYGDTAYASMSEWPIKGDINNDNVANMVDFAILAMDWLEREEWFNYPPHVYITEPPDGFEFPWLQETVILAVKAWDVDGSVVKVQFFANGIKHGSEAVYHGDNCWKYLTCFDVGTYIITAEATDDDGATTTSLPITITAVEY